MLHMEGKCIQNVWGLLSQSLEILDTAKDLIDSHYEGEKKLTYNGCYTVAFIT